MNFGKVSSVIMKRSVLKQLHTKRKETIFAPSVYEMCAGIKITDTATVVVADAYSGGNTNAGSGFTVAQAVNEAAAKGAEVIGVCVRIVMPQGGSEMELASMTADMEGVCTACGIQLLNIKVEVSPLVIGTMIYVTALGSMSVENTVVISAEKSLDIVLSKWVGLEGSLRVLAEKNVQLSDRFTDSFLMDMAELKTQLIALPEIHLARAAGVKVMRQIGQGGIMAALWELANQLGVGIQVEAEQISIRQETIEICEYFQLNPYRLTSAGSMLMLAHNGQQLAERLEREGIKAMVLGQTVSGRERIVTRGQEKQYIDRPGPDELLKLFGTSTGENHD